MFSADELRRLVRWLPNGDAIFRSLPGEGVSPARLTNDLVGVLDRYGALGDDFFTLLRRERPNRVVEIESVRKQLAVSQDPTRLVSSDAPGSSTPIDLVDLTTDLGRLDTRALNTVIARVGFPASEDPRSLAQPTYRVKLLLDWAARNGKLGALDQARKDVKGGLYDKRILVIDARPDARSADLAHEVKRIEDFLERSEGPVRLIFEARTDLHMDDLLTRLLDTRLSIVQLIGDLSAAAGGFQLYDDYEKAYEPLRGEALAELLRKRDQPLDLIFVTAAGTQAAGKALSSLRVPVIWLSGPIDERHMWRFANGIYQELARGTPFAEAVERARAQVFLRDPAASKLFRLSAPS